MQMFVGGPAEVRWVKAFADFSMCSFSLHVLLTFIFIMYY